jgi:hypothetical protein
MASCVEGSAEETHGTTRRTTSTKKRIFLELKGMLTFRATRYF